MKVRRALLSVHDKTGVVDFARGLAGLGVEIVSTGGTARLLRESGVPVRDVSEVTGFPEMLDGRVKTLHPQHPRRHPGPARRAGPPGGAGQPRHPAHRPRGGGALSLRGHGGPRPTSTLAEAIEQIDVGGPTMIRAAAKNHASVAVVTDPGQYAAVLEELRATRRAGRGDRASGWPARRSAGPRSTTPPSPPTWPGWAEPTRRPPRRSRPRSRWRPSANRPCATARTRTRRPPSTGSRGRRRSGWRA